MTDAGDPPLETTSPVVSPLSSRDGFVDDGSGVAAHYGNPLGEQRLLARGAAIVDLSDRGVLTVTGPDRLSWLNSLTSQALGGLAPGVSTETLLLDANGRLEHAARVLDDGETTWLLVDRHEVEPLGTWLDRMRFMLRVEVADRTSEVATIGSMHDLLGGAEDVAATVPVLTSNETALVWVDPWHEVTAGGYSYADSDGHPGHDWTYRESLVRRSDLDALAALPTDRLAVAGTLALEALRIEAWRPRLSTEVDDRTIPHELDWMRSAVHLTKGCYRGQETVAKVHNIGHPPRRLVMLHLDGSEGVLPERGAEVVLAPAPTDSDSDTAGGAVPDSGATAPKSVGHVTSVALHHELGPVALAVVKRSTDEAAPLAVLADGLTIAAAQEIVVPASAGAAAGVPRLPRLGAVRR
ncbi:folate-binding protein YgfZ [Frigoribacterium sp. VKM Ac-2836]|uniref:CAF17-like 4Fe-4S cluster assembly/insertion protein YgfZ n=1 Tax=Frigoribacterium sp. VKM Ac-2836 TaxID=2739014 RepID=UPI001564E669|nr:folate-binding protein YgfZ [Frigoribacterium sp. VKM Ac-2836]NRD26847.1 folate-binding protein YgfZ [Frigoribacterium sp. VKM Ac-2836]